MNPSTALPPSAHHYLHQLTHQHWDELRRFAERRLWRVRDELPPHVTLEVAAEDLVQEVLLATLQGRRRPRPGSLVSLDTFLHWLRSCLNSHLDNHRRSTSFLHAAHADEAQRQRVAQPARGVDSLALLQELRAEFTHQPAMLKVLAVWEAALQRPGPGRFPTGPAELHQAARRCLQPDEPLGL